MRADNVFLFVLSFVRVISNDSLTETSIFILSLFILGKMESRGGVVERRIRRSGINPGTKEGQNFQKEELPQCVGRSIKAVKTNFFQYIYSASSFSVLNLLVFDNNCMPLIFHCPSVPSY